MKRTSVRSTLAGLVAAGILAAAAPLLLGGCAGYRYGAEVDISNASPPPRVYFHSRPHYDVVYGVYVVSHDDYDGDYDVFGYGGYWYAYTGEYWYRASGYNGPYVVISARSVPTRIYEVPSGRWKHHPHGGPPGQQKKHERNHGHGYDWES